MRAGVTIINNKVTNYIVLSEDQNLEEISTDTLIYADYDPEIHPWGPGGAQDIEVGLGWRDRLKEKLGYCIFCGDNVV